MVFSLRPKRDLSSLLEGFVDIHCHLLPGLDDGAKDIRSSKSMLDAYKSLGITGVIATPHVLKGIYPNRKEGIDSSFTKLQQAAGQSILIRAAAEHMLDEDFESLLAHKNLLLLKDNMVLVEMSYYSKSPQLQVYLFNMQNQGYKPILAHPERYQYYTRLSEYQDLKKRGCSFQLNLLSLSDHYGSEVRRKAEMLLKKGLYDYAGTDAHHVMHLKKIGQLKVAAKLFPYLETIMKNNQNFQ